MRDADQGRGPNERTLKILLVIWWVLLVPWLPFALLAGLAFDGGNTPEAHVFVWSVYTYPFTIGAATLLRKKVPILVFLPTLNFLGFIFGGF